VLTWTSGRVTFPVAALLDSSCPPLVKCCWCRGCPCQTDSWTSAGKQSAIHCKKGFSPTPHLRSYIF